MATGTLTEGKDHMPLASSRRGVLASVAASTLFGIIFLVPPHLRDLESGQIFGYRIVLMIGFLTLYFTATKAWSGVRTLAHRLQRTSRLVGVLIADAALLGTQMWLFGWAPVNGHGLALSLGYLILPLVMVLVGVLAHGEHVTRARLAAIGFPALGVGTDLFIGGGIGWPTALVALGFPPYFDLRRRFQMDGAAAQLLELVAMSPVAIGVLALDPSWHVVAQRPSFILWLLFLGALSAAAFALYLTAGRLLPFGLFGVLGYVEPLLLAAFSVTVLGEPWTAVDTYTYVPIGIGLGLMASATLSPTER